MKAILIRIAIILFLRWLDKDKENYLLNRIFEANSKQDLKKAFEAKDTETSIDDIVTDIEDETISLP